jgi:hypothetical protein
MNFLSARPRRAPWVQCEDISSEEFRLSSERDSAVLEINQGTKLIWDLCDGVLSTQQLLDHVQNSYPDQLGIADQISETIQAFNNAALLLFDGGEDALEYTGGVVRQHEPTPALEIALTTIKDFLLEALEVYDTEPISSDFDLSLGHDALISAMLNDADSAGGNQDSKVISYRRAMAVPTVSDNVEVAVRELHSLLPEVSSEIEISGNAIYLRGSHMGWHSNHSRSDGRIYCSWAEHGDTNFFRYQHPLTGKVVTEWERAGWNIKSFTIPPRPYRFWHCIGAKSLRLSLGFRYSLPSKK